MPMARLPHGGDATHQPIGNTRTQPANPADTRVAAAGVAVQRRAARAGNMLRGCGEVMRECVRALRHCGGAPSHGCVQRRLRSESWRVGLCRVRWLRQQHCHDLPRRDMCAVCMCVRARACVGGGCDRARAHTHTRTHTHTHKEWRTLDCGTTHWGPPSYLGNNPWPPVAPIHTNPCRHHLRRHRRPPLPLPAARRPRRQRRGRPARGPQST